MTKIFVNMRPDSATIERLEAPGNFKFDVIEEHIEGSRRDFDEARISNADVMFCDHPPANFDAMKQLKMIQLASVGYTQLAGLELAEKEIQACNARGVFDVPIAEWNISMLINLARDFRGMIRNQERGEWDRDARFQNEIRGATVGIWGYGGIGRETARMGKLLGLKIHAMTRSGPAKFSNIYGIPGTGDPNAELPDRFFTQDQKTKFLEGLDFLILAMPLSPATEGIIGEAELKTLPDHACVLNPARGPLIQEAALLKALNENWIAGAALDTHYHYPMQPDHPLWKMPNVIMTPHISGSSGSPHFLTRVWDIFAQNLERLKTGELLLNEIDLKSVR
ncbi:MAG: D-2-hydroxyacid dehydrogenase [Verrucomicrobiales bacterium]